MEPSVDRSAVLRDVTSGLAAAEKSARTDGTTSAPPDSMNSAELTRFITTLRALQAAVVGLGPAGTGSNTSDGATQVSRALMPRPVTPSMIPVVTTRPQPTPRREPL